MHLSIKAKAKTIRKPTFSPDKNWIYKNCMRKVLVLILCVLTFSDASWHYLAWRISWNSCANQGFKENANEWVFLLVKLDITQNILRTCFLSRKTRCSRVPGITAPKSHYPPGNHHASHFWKCLISRSKPPANHWYWWPDTLSLERQQVKGHQYRWLAGSYDLEIGHF